MDPIDDQTAFDLDIDAAIVRDEREHQDDDVDQRLAGAVLVEVCITLRGHHIFFFQSEDFM